MSIIGLGTDIVEMQRIADVLSERGETFKKRLLTEAENNLASKRDEVIFCAGRWAAKEACSKALGCGIGKQCSFTDIEILNALSGQPEITLKGAALARFEQLGGKTICLSISHERHYAVATVIIS